ncbi:hypothetical protein, partial [Pseudomonas mandelii]|uniref:hypothetical protein n=1 Tax=Pseudomonas mandelii TaxID=75612 RepID=UPI001E533AF4
MSVTRYRKSAIVQTFPDLSKGDFHKMSRPFSRDVPLQSSMILSHFVVPDERSACLSLEPQLTTRKRKMCSPPAY